MHYVAESVVRVVCLTRLTMPTRTAQVAARKEASDRFLHQVGDVMKEKGDLFDTMFEAEEKIRLGEEGWKERYYQVQHLCCCLSLSIR